MAKGMVEALRHLIETVDGTPDEFIGDQFLYFLFRIHIILVNFVGLLEKSCFNFD